VGASDEAFLESLLRAVLESTEAVDTAVVLLREGDVLRVRAAVGLEEEVEQGFFVRILEGFAGRIAASRQPLFIRDAGREPDIESKAIREKGVRALYGVPMMREGQVIGVAHIGSLTAYEFSEEDKLLFRTMVSRATSGVVKAQILADLRRAEAAQRFLSDASRQFAESLNYEATLKKIAHLAVPTIADWCVVDLVEDGRIRRVSVAHSDPSREQLARDLEEQYPVDAEAPSGVPNVIRTGLSEWRDEITDGELAGLALGPQHLTILRRLGITSYIVAPMSLRGDVLGTIALVTSDAKRRYSAFDVLVAEDLARRAAAAIDNARLYSDAQNAIAVRERVLAVVSHDLRNQLGIIGMGANLLVRSAPSLESAPDINKPIETIQRTVGTMQHLVDDLLDMASIHAGRLSFDPEWVELEPILEEAHQSHEVIARAKGLRVQADFAVHGVRVCADRKRILQVLGNLLGNAIKFTDSGGIMLQAETRSGEAMIVVRDTGPGIPSSELETIFEPYRTIRREGKAGTGLGLYIARGIVQAHGRRLWVESTPGAGSSFFFTLPAEPRR
jgi:signal transduction histidine kinase/putative methionine-R-sulfoxide reductase with GAF domain